jgi:hypothetical protein
MKSVPVRAGQTGYTGQYDALRDDARGAATLLAHQQLGALALPTNPSNTQTWTLTINSTAVSGTFVTGTPTNPGDVKVAGTAAGTAQNLLNLLQNPQVSTANQVAVASANQALVVFGGYALNGTTITVFSLNNSAYSPVTSFTASTTATGGSWTAQTLQLYVEPGVYYVNGTRVIFTGGNTPTFTGPVSNPRIDLVTIDSTGTLAIVQGTENASPVAPSYPANKIVLCEVYNVVGETAIYDNANQQTGQGYISNDVRPVIDYVQTPTAFASDLDPDVTDTRQIGSSSANEWLNIYVKNIYASSLLQLNGINVGVSKFGGTGADGALSISSGTTTLNVGGASVYVKNYTSISITGTGKLAFSNPNANGTIIILKSQGNVTITSSAGPAIDVRGMGASGGTGASSGGGSSPNNAYTAAGQGLAGGATAGSSGHTNNTNSATSGNVFASWVDGISMGPAFPGNSTTNPNVGAINNANSALTAYHKYYVLPGGGGAGNEGGSSSSGGNGGIGGGGLYIECGGAWNFTTAINSAGGAPTGTYLGGGGGGGSVQILYNTLTANSGTITVSGDSTNGSAVGGNGLSYVGANTEFS